MLASGSMTYHAGRAINFSSHKNNLNLIQFLPKNLQHTTKKMNRLILGFVTFMRKAHQNHLTMESTTKDLVSQAHAQVFPKSTLSFHLQFFLPEQLKLEGQWQIAIAAGQSTKISQKEGSCFLLKNLKNVSFSLQKLVCFFPSRNLLKP